MEAKANNCEFANDVVDYLYGEANEARRNAFEDHLLDCTACIDEFAEVSNSRFAVFEWQRDEFAPLATPQFVIPYDDARPGLVAGLRERFSAGWAAPAFAFAAIAIVAGLAFVFAGGTTSEQAVAEVEKPLELQKPSTPVDTKAPEVVTSVATIPARASAAGVKTAERPRLAARMPRPARTEKRVAVQSPSATIQARATTVRRAPVLSSDAEVDDDESLRLADLFDSEGTR
jgi:anti-sigma factor RsiW